MTTNVSLTPDLEKFIAQKLKNGGYKSTSEIVREGLRLLKDRDVLREAKLKALKKEIQEGLSSGKPTRLNIQKIKVMGRKRLATKAKKANA